MDLREEPGDLGGPQTIQGLELRAAAMGEFKDMDEGKREVQVVFPHETIDSYRTVFAPDAFRESFKRQLPLICWQHKLDEPIGRATSAQALSDRSEVIAHFDDPEHVPLAGRALSQIKSRTLTDWSFGFKNAKYEKAETLGKGVRRITGAFMAEASPVSIGSIPGAVATGIREDEAMNAATEIIPVPTLWEMRQSGIIAPEVFEEMLVRMHPDLEGKVRMPVRDDGEPMETGTSWSDGDDDDTDEEAGWTPGWTAEDSGMHTATGPNGEHMAVTPATEGDGHLWVVVDGDGEPMGGGKEETPDAAKGAAEQSVTGRADWTSLELREMDWSDPEVVIDADMVRAVLYEFTPGLAAELEGAKLTLSPRDDGGGDVETPGPEQDSPYVRSMAEAVEASLDSAMQHLDGTDMGALPDNVQQALALVQSAGSAACLLREAMGIDIEAPREEEEDFALAVPEEMEARAAAAGFSTKPWSDFSQSDYSPEQWKSACLINGSGDGKDASSLPVKEPDGTYNVNGIAAAAGRLGSTDASDDDKASAAKALMSLYGKMKKPVPPTVLKLARRSEDEEDLERRQAADEKAAMEMLGSMA